MLSLESLIKISNHNMLPSYLQYEGFNYISIPKQLGFKISYLSDSSKYVGQM